MSFSEDNHKSIVEFLAREFAREESRSCLLVELCHASPGTRGRTLSTWDRKEKPELFEGMGNVETLATEILRLAEMDADTNGLGSHRYEIRTQQYLGGRQSRAFKVVVEEGGGGSEGLFPERSTPDGQIQQQMRHNEFMMRTMMQMVGTMTSSYQGQIRQMSEENQRMSADRGKMIRRLEENEHEENERSMRLLLAQSADERKTEILNKMVLPLAPIILAKLISGGKSTGGIESNSALAQLTNNFFKSLSDDQIRTIMGALNMSQMMMLKEASEVAAANVAPAKPSGANGQPAPAPPGQPAAPASP